MFLAAKIQNYSQILKFLHIFVISIVLFLIIIYVIFDNRRHLHGGGIVKVFKTIIVMNCFANLAGLLSLHDIFNAMFGR